MRYPLSVNWVKNQLTTKDRKSGSVKKRFRFVFAMGAELSFLTFDR
jgi:hypothetical protein